MPAVGLVWAFVYGWRDDAWMVRPPHPLAGGLPGGPCADVASRHGVTAVYAVQQCALEVREGRGRGGVVGWGLTALLWLHANAQRREGAGGAGHGGLRDYRLHPLLQLAPWPTMSSSLVHVHVRGRTNNGNLWGLDQRVPSALAIACVYKEWQMQSALDNT